METCRCVLQGHNRYTHRRNNRYGNTTINFICHCFARGRVLPLVPFQSSLIVHIVWSSLFCFLFFSLVRATSIYLQHIFHPRPPSPCLCLHLKDNVSAPHLHSCTVHCTRNFFAQFHFDPIWCIYSFYSQKVSLFSLSPPNDVVRAVKSAVRQ